MNGFFNLFKPKGKTSHDIVGFARKILHDKRIGHAGTLDPDAEGVLPIAIGRATRLIDFLPSNKSYRFELIFGIETDSGDLSGKIIECCEGFELPTQESIVQTLKKFIGEIEQIPPKFSAIKIHGRKAYEMARKDLEFEIPSRLVKIERLELLKISSEQKSIECEVDCSKGTYIRSLCVDIGRALNIPSTMGKLIRTRVGDFKLEDSIQIENLSADQILKPEDCLKNLPRFDLKSDRTRAFLNGLSTRICHALEGNYRVFSDEKFLGIGFVKDSEIFPKVVLN